MNIWSDFVIWEYLESMTSMEKVYLLLVIGLIVTLVFVIVKFKKYSQELIEKFAEKESVMSDEKTKVKEDFQQEENQAKIELDAVIEQMRKDLEKQKQLQQQQQQEVDPIKKFEEEQEEKSIISYQELLDANQKEKEEVKKEELSKETSIEEKTNFQNSEIISPIFGRIKTEIEYPTIPKIRRSKLGNDEEEEEIVKVEKQPKFETKEKPVEKSKTILDVLNKEVSNEQKVEPKPKEELISSITQLEKTISMDKLQKELLKNEEFLKTLREFRKKLD